MHSDVYASERYDASQKLGEEVRSSGGAGLIYNKRPERYYPAKQSATPGFVRTLWMSWSRAFDDRIPLPRSRQLVTLKDAANYIQRLPKAEQDLEEWQAAVEALLLVVDLNGPTMMARIGIMRALNRGYVREFNTSRRDTHCGASEN
jgi:hypothetical protein